MASLKDIRVRIESTKNTQQITKAMKLVSASKLRKAQHQIVNLRPYAHSIVKVISDIAASERVSHPLMESVSETKNQKVLMVVLTSDRGLCGGFNSNILKTSENLLKELRGAGKTVELFLIGRKAIEFFARRGEKPVESITRLDKDASYLLASQIAERLIKNYLQGDYEEVRLVFNEFKSAISQKVISSRLLPIELETIHTESETKSLSFSSDMIFEPKPESMIEELLIKYFSVQVYRCMCESVAAEHGARMTAMENASNNAREVLSKLTLTYNKIRQEKITTELIEIVSGAQAT